LQMSFDAQEQAARDLSVQAAEYYVLESNLKRAEKLCDILDDRIKEINAAFRLVALNNRSNASTIYISLFVINK